MRTKIVLALLLAVAVNARAEDYRAKNQATTIPVEYRNATTGAWISAATGSDCECGYFTDGSTPAVATFADCTNEATEFATNSGRYYLQLSASEMNHDFVLVKCHSTSSSAVDYSATISTIGRVASSIASGGITSASVAARGTAQAVSSTTLTLAASESWGDNALANKYGLYIVSASGGNAGVYTCITANVGSTDVVTVAWPNSLAPSGTITYDLIPDAGCGASVDASAVWAYGSRALTDKSGFALSGTQTFNVTGNITGNLSGSVGSVATVSDKTGYSAACTLGTDAITAASVSSGAGNKIADHVIRRNTSNVEASSDGDTLARKSLLGSTAQQTHRVAIVGDTMTTYRSDGTTVLGTRTVTSSASAAPITGTGN